MVRLIDFPNHPSGLNQDEASIGYDAWSILNYGIDRNGVSYPVHLVSWGSGQNALYAYLSMPFIALFGLNVFSVRIVNLLFSLLTIIAVFFIIKRFKGFKTAIIGMGIVAVAPWNIMLSRWGLESNLFPGILILAIWALVASFDKKRLVYLAVFLFAVSMYSYGSSYLVVTVFCLAAFCYIIFKKLIPIKQCIFGTLIFIIFSLPIYLFVLINVFGWESIKIGAITIPHEYGERLTSVSGLTGELLWKNIYDNLFMQNDGQLRNTMEFYGCFYVISTPFYIFGIVKSIKNHKPFDIIMLFFLGSSLTLFFVYQDPNANRLNSMYVPLIIFTAVGISDLFKSKTAMVSIITAYAICFTGFSVQYFSQETRSSLSKEFYSSYDEAILKAEELSGGTKPVYDSTSVLMPYIFNLFYTQPDPNEFVNQAVINNRGAQFQMVGKFKNFEYYSAFEPETKKGIYIIENDKLDNNQKSKYETYSYENYTVVLA
ncbi:MAG: glycosyltransferase family 39 protein [Ruminococcus sp.]|nr:glycosyltransferase family 39 protein [Ruminococcus sp.]